MFKFLKNINKKALITLAFAAVIFLTGISWIVIRNALAAYKPVSMNIDTNERETVSGNGSNAVIVGNYLYFIGNYVDTSTITYKQNEYNKVEYGAIYRVKLENGSPIYEDSERTLTDPDYLAHLVKKSHYQLIVPKIAGFNNSALYVFDKYLIYTSPNNTKDKYGSLQTSKIDFFRVNLDGNNHKHIYTTSSDSVSNSDFTVACYGSAKNIYLLIKDGDNLRRVNVTGNVGSVDTISKSVTSFVLPVVSAYYKGDGEDGTQYNLRNLSASYGGVMNFVYYTEALSEDDTKMNLKGNVLKQYWVSKGNSDDRNKTLAKINNNEFKVLTLSNGKLMYTITDTNSIISNPPLYITSPSVNNNADTTAEPFALSTRDKYLILDSSDYLSEETFYLPTELTPGIDDFRFASIVQGTSGSYLIRYKKVFGTKGMASIVETTGGAIKIEAASIIEITGSKIYYKNSSGEVMSVSLDGNEAPKSTGLKPDSSVRLTFFTKGGKDRIFYIKTFTEGEHTTTCAVMAELTSDGYKEYILGRIDDKYLPDAQKTDSE